METGCVDKEFRIPVDVNDIKKLHDRLVVNPKHTYASKEIREIDVTQKI